QPPLPSVQIWHMLSHLPARDHGRISSKHSRALVPALQERSHKCATRHIRMRARHGRGLDESAEKRANIATRAGGGKFTSSAQLAGDGTSTPGALVATHCVAVKAKLEWQSPRQ